MKTDDDDDVDDEWEGERRGKVLQQDKSLQLALYFFKKKRENKIKDSTSLYREWESESK